MHKALRSLLDSIGSNPHLFVWLQKISNLGSFRKPVSGVLRAGLEESIIDVGCGAGMYSTLAKCRYMGIDLNESYIKYAQSKYSGLNKEFVAGDILKLNFGSEIFDKALYLAMLHHFSEQENLLILRKISAVISKMVVILDAVIPERPTAMQKLFLSVERGKYLRSVEEQQRIIEQVFDVKNVSIHYNRSRFGCCSIFDCYPKKGVFMTKQNMESGI